MRQTPGGAGPHVLFTETETGRLGAFELTVEVEAIEEPENDTCVSPQPIPLDQEEISLDAQVLQGQDDMTSQCQDTRGPDAIYSLQADGWAYLNYIAISAVDFEPAIYLREGGCEEGAEVSLCPEEGYEDMDRMGDMFLDPTREYFLVVDSKSEEGGEAAGGRGAGT